MTERPRAMAFYGRWRDLASCRGLGPALFYPGPEEPSEQASAAKSICAACPVRQACLEHALAAREPDGVWGGLTEGERRRLLRTSGSPDRRRTTMQPARRTPIGDYGLIGDSRTAALSSTAGSIA